MAIKQLNRDPQVSDFTTEDIVINSTNGNVFYKTESNVINKIPGSNEIVLNSSGFVTTSFQLVYFASDWKHHNYEKAISWKSINENATLHADDCYLFPFGGEIHSLFFKAAGVIPKIKLKIYKNLSDLDKAYGMSVNAIDTSLGNLPTGHTVYSLFILFYLIASIFKLINVPFSLSIWGK